MKNTVYLLFFNLLPILTLAQNDSTKTFTLSLQGRIEEYNSGRSLESVSVFVINAMGDTLAKQMTAINGKFNKIKLDFGYVYIVLFKKSGYFSKHILIDSKTFPDSSYVNSDFPLEVSCSLFEGIPEKYSFCLDDLDKNPYARVKFFKDSENFEWDISYTEKRREEFFKLYEKVYECYRVQRQYEFQQIIEQKKHEEEDPKTLKPIKIYGTITDYFKGDSLSNGIIGIYKDNYLVTTVTTDENGYFEYDKIYYGRAYDLRFKCENYIFNMISIDLTHGIDSLRPFDSLEIKNEMLYKIESNCNLSYLQSIEKAYFGYIQFNSLSFDKRYTWNKYSEDLYLRYIKEWAECIDKKK